jgi:hypothetical protein
MHGSETFQWKCLFVPYLLTLCVVASFNELQLIFRRSPVRNTSPFHILDFTVPPELSLKLRILFLYALHTQILIESF